jgi:hypothetical protein
MSQTIIKSFEQITQYKVGGDKSSQTSRLLVTFSLNDNAVTRDGLTGSGKRSDPELVSVSAPPCGVGKKEIRVLVHSSLRIAPRI